MYTSGARLGPRGQHVELPDPPHRERAEHLAAHRNRDHGARGRRASRARDLDPGDGAPESREMRHVFLMLGALPNTRWLDGCVALDERGFVKTGADLAPADLEGWNLPATALSARDQRARRIRRGRCAGGQQPSESPPRSGEGSASVQFIHRALQRAGRCKSFARPYHRPIASPPLSRCNRSRSLKRNRSGLGCPLWTTSNTPQINPETRR